MRADVPCTTKEIAEVCTKAKGEQPVAYFGIRFIILLESGHMFSKANING